MENQFMADKLIQLEQMFQEQQNELASLTSLKQTLREQQAELASLREALAQKRANRPASATVPGPVQLKTPDTSRRKMLKRMGLAVLAGGAALGITAATYAPAEAKLTINPSSNPNVGAVITRNGATITGIPAGPTAPNFGLLVSSDNSFNASTVLTGVSGYDVGVIGSSFATNGIGVIGYSFATNGIGVKGYGISGTGVYGSSPGLGTGVQGKSTDGIGVIGQTGQTLNPAILAENLASTSGVALQIQQGGLTVKGATIGSQTAAFIHQTTPDNTYPNTSIIDNPLCNGKPDALLFVTHNSNPPNAVATIYETKTFGVYYSVDSSKWRIYIEDQTAIPQNLYFNVLIINP